MIEYEDATEEMAQAWHDAFCLECKYLQAKQHGGCDEKDCFEFHQEYYPEEFKETMKGTE